VTKSGETIHIGAQKIQIGCTVQREISTEQPRKMNLFLLISSMPRTVITSKMKLIHIPLIGGKTQKNTASKRSKPRPSSRPKLTPNPAQVGDDFLSKINIIFKQFERNLCC